MSYRLAVLDKPGYLHFQVTGRNSPETVRNYLSEIQSISRNRGVDAVLVEENLKGPGLGITEIFHIVLESIEQPLTVRRIAYLDTNIKHDPERMQFAETVARNRGVWIRVFSTIDEAEQWLHQPSDK